MSAPTSMSPSLLLLELGAGAVLLYLVGHCFYNVFLHPLRSYPGPKLWAATRVPFAVSQLRGKHHYDLLRLHETYGSVVRTAPDELSYTDGRAWNDICGHRKASQGEFGKHPLAVNKTVSGADSVLRANRADHGRQRKALSHGFSEKGMKQQQPLIQGYVDLLISRLRERCKEGAQNMVTWYNWTTFDLIGHLAFGEPFGCLEDQKTHPWILAVFGNIKAALIFNLLRRFRVDFIIPYLVSKDLQELRKANFMYGVERIDRRVKEGSTGEGGFFDDVLGKSDAEKGTGMTQDEMVVNATFLILAGSETTATLLSGVTWLMLTNPEVLKKVTAEVREAFQTEGEIDIASVSNLEYMLACLNEGLRLYPPVPVQIPRMAPAEGGMVCGQWVPPGTTVMVQPFSSYRLESHYHRAFEFLPQRWLNDPEFANDDHELFQPFSFGPRNCLGRNLAYAEMRLILAKILYNFDLSLSNQMKNGGDWIAGQDTWSLWDKTPLWVDLMPVDRKA